MTNGWWQRNILKIILKRYDNKNNLFAFPLTFSCKGNNYRIEPVWDGKQTSITEYRVVDEFGNTIFVGDAESCNLFVNGLMSLK